MTYNPPPPPPRRALPMSPRLSRDALLGEIALHSPANEPMRVSAQRLVNTIVKDAVFDSICHASVWHAYKTHPELSRPLPPSNPLPPPPPPKA